MTKGSGSLMMIQMSKNGKSVLVLILTVAFVVSLAWVSPVMAIAENEQAWIEMERGNTDDALVLVLNQSDVLSRWLVAVLELKNLTPPTDQSPVSKAARAFEKGDYDLVVKTLQPILDESDSLDDSLQLRLRLAAAMVELGSLEDAEIMLSLAITEAQLQHRKASEFFGLVTRARARARLRQIDPPREDLLSALSLARKMNTHRWSGVAAIGLSVISRLQMDLDDSLYWREAALQHYRHAGDLGGQAQALHYIATIGILKGELTQAMTQLQDADALARKANEKDQLGSILGEMAAINYLLGDFDKALDQYNEAVRLAPNPWRRGMMLVNVGSIHEYRGQFDKAVPALEEALQLMRQVGDHRTETKALQSLGEALCEMEQCERGLVFLDESIAKAREYEIPMSEAYALEIKGQALLQRGDLKGAASAFDAATVLAKQINYFDILEWSLLGQAQVARAEGKPEQALEHLHHALTEVAAVRRRSGGADRVTSGIVNQAGRIYQEMISLLFEMHQANDGAGYELQAYDVAQEARARAFLDLMTEAEYDLQISSVPGYRELESNILTNIIDLETRLAGYGASADSDANTNTITSDDSVGSLKAQLAAAEDELQLLEARLRSTDPRYAEVLYPAPLSSAEVRKNVLQPGELMLEYSLGEESSFLWVLSSDNVTMVTLPGSEKVEKEVRQLLPLLRDYNLTGVEAAWYVEPARQVYKMLLEPVAAEIAQSERLIIAADGILHYLPFEALLSRDTSSNSYSDLPWLVQEKVITYTPSASVLAQVRKSIQVSQEPGDWLLVGDPVLVDGENAGLFARAAGAAGLPPLPFAAKELEALEAIAPQKSFGVEVLAGSQATHGNLLKASSGRALDQLHFACHGLFNEARPRYSGLVISPETNGEDDGFLSIPEVLALDLDCQQVVLSACASALGPHVSGEGLVGLTRSFMFAGARSVVSALWDVSGRQTTQFMVVYYEELVTAENDRATTLAVAKRVVISQKTKNGLDGAHPAFWASFVLSGAGE